jgi:hypothetical protein
VVRLKQAGDIFGIEPLGPGREADEVGKENRDELALVPWRRGHDLSLGGGRGSTADDACASGQGARRSPSRYSYRLR